MTTLVEHETLSREEKVAALAQVYLELRLSVETAFDAAQADLAHLDAFAAVAEADR